MYNSMTLLSLALCLPMISASISPGPTVQRVEVDMNYWNKNPPSSVILCRGNVLGIVSSVDKKSITVRPVTSPTREVKNDGTVTFQENNPLIENFRSREVRVYFTGQLAQLQVPIVMSTWTLKPHAHLLHKETDHNARYLPSNVKVGDHVSLDGLAIYDGTPVCGSFSIKRRVGGMVPPLPGWKPNPKRNKHWQLGYHERQNLVNEHEDKGLPYPTNDEFVRRYMPKAWAKQQREKQLESIPHIKD